MSLSITQRLPDASTPDVTSWNGDRLIIPTDDVRGAHWEPAGSIPTTIPGMPHANAEVPAFPMAQPGTPTGSSPASAPAAPAPSMPASTAPATASGELSALGTGFGNTRPPQMLWNAHSVNLVIEAGRAQQGIDPAQSHTNAQLADAAMAALGQSGGAQVLAPADLAVLLQASGLPFERQDPSQLIAAARFVSGSTDAGQLRLRLGQALDGFHILAKIGHPQLTQQQMKDLLWGAASVPGHAFGTMNDAEVAARYQDVAAALNGQAGEHKVRIGKHELKFELDQNGVVSDASTRKPGIWGKIGRWALTVASFVPIPVIAIPARIASAALSTVDGIRNGHWLQAVAGAAGVVGASASAIAGSAVSGTAATTARIANQAARAATAVQTGIDTYRGQRGVGLLAGVLQTTSNAAGAFAQGAGTVADVARQVQTWSNRTLVGTRVVVDVGQGRYGDAIANGARLSADIAGDFKDDSGRLDPRAALVRQIAGYGANAGGIVSRIQQRAFAAALTDAATLTRRIDGAQAGGPKDGSDSRVADWLEHGAVGVQVAQSLRQGAYPQALTRGADLLDDITDGMRGNHGKRPAGVTDPRPAWARMVSDWLDYGAAGVELGQAAAKRSYDTMLTRGARLLDDVADGVSGNQGRRPAGAPDMRPEWARTMSTWLDYAAAAFGMARGATQGRV